MHNHLIQHIEQKLSGGVTYNQCMKSTQKTSHVGENRAFALDIWCADTDQWHHQEKNTLKTP